MPRFEYRVERFHPGDTDSSSVSPTGLTRCTLMNELGAEGWELVSVVGEIPYDLIFKRKVASSESRARPDPKEEKE